MDTNPAPKTPPAKEYPTIPTHAPKPLPMPPTRSLDIDVPPSDALPEASRAIVVLDHARGAKRLSEDSADQSLSLSKAAKASPASSPASSAKVLEGNGGFSAFFGRF